MRTIRSFLFLIAIAVLIAACGSAASSASRAQPAAQAGGRDRRQGAQRRPADGAPPANPRTGVRCRWRPDRRAVDDAKIIRTGTMSTRGQRRRRGAAYRARRDRRPRRLRRSVDHEQRRRPAVGLRSPTASRPPDGRSALDLLRGLNGLTTKVVTEQTEAVEVTSQVIDLEARIAQPASQRDRPPGDRREGDQDQRRPRGPGPADPDRAARSRRSRPSSRTSTTAPATPR